MKQMVRIRVLAVAVVAIASGLGCPGPNHGIPEPQGQVTEEQIAEAVHRRSDALLECLSGEGVPDAQRPVSVTVDVGRSGLVERISPRGADGRELPPEADGCIRARLITMQFVPSHEHVRTRVGILAIGYLSREQIEGVVRRHAGRIRGCYERALARDATLGGRITMLWTIDREGRPADVVIRESTMGNPEVESCVELEVEQMRFDPPDGGLVMVTYPFSFRTEEQPPLPEQRTRDSVQRSMRELGSGVRSCAQIAFARPSCVEGTANYTMSLLSGGEATDVTRSDPGDGLVSEEFDACMIELLEAHDFGAVQSEAPLWLSYPFVLRRSDDEDCTTQGEALEVESGPGGVDLSREEVWEALRPVFAEFPDCFVATAGSEDREPGVIRLIWTVAPDGAVTDAQHDAIGVADETADCLLSLIREIRFRARPGGDPVEIVYPFRVE